MKDTSANQKVKEGAVKSSILFKILIRVVTVGAVLIGLFLFFEYGNEIATTRKVKIGMSREEVRSAIGEPKMQDVEPTSISEDHWMYYCLTPEGKHANLLDAYLLETFIRFPYFLVIYYDSDGIVLDIGTCSM